MRKYEARVMPSPNYGAVWVRNNKGEVMAQFHDEKSFTEVMGVTVEEHNAAHWNPTSVDPVSVQPKLTSDEFGPLYSEADVLALLRAVIGPDRSLSGERILTVKWSESHDVSEHLPPHLVTKLIISED